MALLKENINNLIVDDLNKRNQNWTTIDDSLELIGDNLELKADKTYVDSQGALKADKTYVDNKVKTDVPSGAKFTDTTYSEITTAEIDTGTSSTLRTITGRRVKHILDKVQGWINNLTKADVGLGNVDNIQQATKAEFNIHNSDTIRHITSAERTSWNAKETPASAQTKANTAESNAKSYADTHINSTSNPHGVTKAQVGLGSVDNTSDTSKPISDATQTALNAKANATDLTTHTGSTSNPHSVTKAQVGLGNVDNIKQMPISGGVLENYREKLVIMSATSGAIDLSSSSVFRQEPTANITYSFSNAVSGAAHSFTLIITMGSTLRTLTFPSSVKWQGGEAPDMTAVSKTYILTFLSYDGGTTWLGMFGGEF